MAGRPYVYLLYLYGNAMSNLTKASRRLSYLLRHAPAEEFPLSRSGWASVSDVCKELKITADQLKEIVESDEKGRYKLVKPTYSEAVIKAVQGHSTNQVKIDYPCEIPPSVLYHGTPVDNVASILAKGLNPGERHYVHLSADIETAATVGLRGCSKAAILVLDVEEMRDHGYPFYLAENGVWLIAQTIDPCFITVHEYRNK